MRSSPVVVLAVVLAAAASLSFAVGSYRSQQASARQLAESQAQLEAMRRDMDHLISIAEPRRSPKAAGTAGRAENQAAAEAGGRAELVDAIKQQIQNEMGLLPLRLLRERRESFVELYSYDNQGSSNYGTAGYLGGGHFVTVKHGVIALGRDQTEDESRKVVSIKLMYKGRALKAALVDAGDAEVEVDQGDWAILRVDDPVDLPPLTIDLGYSFDFADPIFRLGNDYSKGIILATGNVGQRTAGGLITCLTDGHPGVSGGGVLDRRGHLVGIQIGRMQGDYRFSFILPLRREMFRKVPSVVDEPVAGRH